MSDLRYGWHTGGDHHEARFVPVPGTAGRPFPFGNGPDRREIAIRPFYIGATPVTRALWSHVMGTPPPAPSESRLPADHVSWHHITAPDGFLDRINAGPVLPAVAGGDPALRFRLPSETEWEYAARGGPSWTDGFTYAGSNRLDDVGWYGRRWTRAHAFVTRVLGRRRGWRLVGTLNRFPPRATHPHDVARKRPNQLGIYDMCGNVWEWCEDVCVEDPGAVPADGSPWVGAGSDRRLRGGCHHNWDFHCSVWWRYGITPDAGDGCIGFRLVLAPASGDDGRR